MQANFETRRCEEKSISYFCSDPSHEMSGSPPQCIVYAPADSMPCTSAATWSPSFSSQLVVPYPFAGPVDFLSCLQSMEPCMRGCDSYTSYGIEQCTSELFHSCSSGFCSRRYGSYESSEHVTCKSRVAEIHELLIGPQGMAAYSDGRSIGCMRAPPGCNHNSWCDSHEDCSCSDCSGDSRCSSGGWQPGDMSGCNYNMMCDYNEDCSCSDCSWDYSRCPSYRRLRGNA
jgi:hypothetical protein